MNAKVLLVFAAVVFFCLAAAGVSVDWTNLDEVGLACLAASFLPWPF